MVRIGQRRSWISPIQAGALRALLAFGVVLVSAVAGAQVNYKVLYTFTGGKDGGFPHAGLVRDSATGNLYGTANKGGDPNCQCGVVFKLDVTGKETVLYSFKGAPDDGSGPQEGNLVPDASGNLYGTTSSGGLSDDGTVFKLDTTGKETVLYSFAGGKKGAFPYAGVVRDGAGNLYGTTTSGGDTNCKCGVVFKLDTTNKESVLYTFTKGKNGSDPIGGLIRFAANLYGTTDSGGDPSCNCGVVFKLDSTNKQSVLYTFTGGKDGASPMGELIRDSAGNLYGTTAGGGGSTNCGFVGCGTVFKIDPTGKETVLHSFDATDGQVPRARLVRDATTGNLYGTTQFGGKFGANCVSGCGVVFRLSSAGNETVLYSFTGEADGAAPIGSLIRDVKTDTLYGTASGVPPLTAGVVFKLD